jgi:hypothetical protein
MRPRSGLDIDHWFRQSSNIITLSTVLSMLCKISGWSSNTWRNMSFWTWFTPLRFLPNHEKYTDEIKIKCWYSFETRYITQNCTEFYFSITESTSILKRTICITQLQVHCKEHRKKVIFYNQLLGLCFEIFFIRQSNWLYI